jgi:hypothetical protein
MNKEEEFNPNEYEVDPEEKEVADSINLLNIYLCYYKQLFQCRPNEHMFEHIDVRKKESTNRCIEKFYDEITKYKESIDQEEKIKLCDPDTFDLNKVDELYLLLLDNEPYKVCQTLFPILEYLSNIDWNRKQWNIIPLKK